MGVELTGFGGFSCALFAVIWGKTESGRIAFLMWRVWIELRFTVKLAKPLESFR